MISIMASFVETMFVCRYYTENVYRKIKRLSFEEGEKTWTVRRHVQTTVIVICVIIPASVINGFSDISNIAGVFTSFITYGLPGLCLVVKFKQQKQKQNKICHYNYEPPIAELPTKLSVTSLLRTFPQNIRKRFEHNAKIGLDELILGTVLLLIFTLVFTFGSISTIYGIVR